MTYSTTNVYRMKREIITFSKKISSRLPRTEQKFFADMLYGMLGSGSCLLSEIAHVLHEDSRKINVVDRLSRHLAKGVQEKALLDYLRLIQSRVPEQPTVYLDDSDVVKPEGQRFEALGIVRDGSASTEKKNVFVKTENYTTKTGGSLRQSCAPDEKAKLKCGCVIAAKSMTRIFLMSKYD